ncbi:MAG: DMT family transporter [SAR324 cluster bacterium]|jgi:drug/metabolite transporter (DMT)-like permease|nr:EamA family transporter [SAR324 cluster bacterium]MCH2265738.1 DMT family transporter [SAR324 cluster bacterium]
MSNLTSASTSHRLGVISILVALPFVSLTGLFGKFLTLSPLLIVQGRTVFAFGTLLLALFVLRKRIFFKDFREWLWLMVSGSILGVHWIAFFQAIQVSTVAIGLLSFASYPLFTTLLEPLFFRESLQRRNVFAALIVICGLALMATSTEDTNAIISGSVVQGLLWGLLAGLGFAVLTLLNRDHVRNHSPLLLTCWQNGFAALVLLPWSWSESWIISAEEWGLLFVLGVVCTVGGHTLLINGLRHVRAQVASLLIAGLEPVFAIVFALFLLREIPSVQTLLGGILIVGTTVFMTRKSN